MSKLFPEQLDEILMNIGYEIVDESVSMSINEITTSKITASGGHNAELDRDKIIEYFNYNGLGITNLYISCNKNITTQRGIGNLSSTVVGSYDEITMEFTCYTDQIPSGAVTIKPYADTKSDTHGFNLRGVL